METFDNRAAFRALGNEIAAELGELAKRHGIEIAYAGGTLGSVKGIIKLELVIPEERRNGQKTEEAEAFEMFAKSMGLDPGLLGTRFLLKRKIYTVKGMNLRARAKPVMIEDLDGREYRMSVDHLKSALKGRA